MAMTTAAFLERALSARQWPTLYWLGKGGWTRAEQAAGRAPVQPGRETDIERELAALRTQRPKVHADYMAGLARTGLSMSSLPRVACDCSGFLCWALGVARDSAPWAGGWIDTTKLHADALGSQHLFQAVERAVPGAIIVYPKPPKQGDDEPPGHVGIVTEADADGRATHVLHCAPENYALPPPDGRPRNAIAQTGPEPFDADPRTTIVTWRGFGV
jgi:hypothetical protein